jgi:hypothetical protein
MEWENARAELDCRERSRGRVWQCVVCMTAAIAVAIAISPPIATARVPDSAWRGPGFYWCGYAWRRGYGWGGGYGWRGR